MDAEGDWADELWPEDRPSTPPGPAPGAAPHHRKAVALTLTAVIALAAGAGAVLIYKNVLAGSTPATAAPSPSSTLGPAPGEGSQPSMLLVAPVMGVGPDSVTVGGPGPSVSARVTSATRFTGSARSLAQVHVGDTVVAQITVSGGVATLVSLQDPASQS